MWQRNALAALISRQRNALVLNLSARVSQKHDTHNSLIPLSGGKHAYRAPTIAQHGVSLWPPKGVLTPRQTEQVRLGTYFALQSASFLREAHGLGPAL